MRVKNWKRFQHFKDRRPPWIKFYHDLLDDPDWHELDPLDAKVLVMLWLIASDDPCKEGALPNMKKISFVTRISERQLSSIIPRLSHWILQDDIIAISPRHQLGPPETETETERETETEKKKNSAEPGNGVGSTHLIWDGKFTGITPQMMTLWGKAYPAVNLTKELYAMDQWLIANPEKRKKNYYRFITNWLSRKQERAR
jgi:hypothetical protein